MGEELNELNADIANVEVRPDDDVGLARHFALSLYFLCGNTRIYCGIELELAVDLILGSSLVRYCEGLAYLVDQRNRQ